MRNAYYFQCHPIHPVWVKNQTTHALYEWNLIIRVSISVSYAGTSTGLWLPPPEGVYKLSFDGALNPFTLLAGRGGIFCNDKSELVMAYTDGTKVSSPLEAELIAL